MHYSGPMFGAVWGLAGVGDALFIQRKIRIFRTQKRPIGSRS